MLAFEPHPKRFESLATAVARNQLDNVVAFRAGLGEHEGVLRLYTNRTSPSLVGGAEETAFETVEIVKLDDILERERVTDVRMVKLDVEGFELAVLKGASRLLGGSNPPLVCIEHERHGGDALEPLKLICAHNAFQLFQLEDTKARASRLRRIKSPEAARIGDNVFCLMPEHVAHLTTRGIVAL